MSKNRRKRTVTKTIGGVTDVHASPHPPDDTSRDRASEAPDRALYNCGRLLSALVTCMLPHSAVCLQTFSRSGHSAIERPKRRSHEDGTASRREHQNHVETSQRSSVGSSFKFRSCVLLVSGHLLREVIILGGMIFRFVVE